jgi:uncharacterized caspase-like protein
MVRIAIALLLILFGAIPAGAEERFALLIGNQSYNANVGVLLNPRDDVDLIAAKLAGLGFTVKVFKDAGYKTMDIEINRHIDNVRRAGDGAISFIYYSGHGAAKPDTSVNYLIPVDAPNADDEDLWAYSLNLNEIIEALRTNAPGAKHYVVFDACRSELKLTRKNRKGLTDKGFAPIAHTQGVMIAFSTEPGKAASDTGTGGGIYAKALADEIVKPGVEAVTMFRRVALRVKVEIGQDPWIQTSTLGEVYFAASPEETQSREAADAWAAVKDTESLAILEWFSAHYKGTKYSEFVQLRAEELAKRQIASALPKESKPAKFPNSPAEKGELTRMLQQQLKRIGCLDGDADGVWGQKSRTAVRDFARYAKLHLESDEPDVSMLDAATAAKTRVCPLVCGDDEVVQGGECVRTPRAPRHK